VVRRTVLISGNPPLGLGILERRDATVIHAVFWISVSIAACRPQRRWDVAPSLMLPVTAWGRWARSMNTSTRFPESARPR